MSDLLTCEDCGLIRALKEVMAMTNYHWDGKGDDPNRSMFLCKDCEDSYVAYWNDRWDEYWSSQGRY